jgi:hypothetical protein
MRIERLRVGAFVALLLGCAWSVVGAGRSSSGPAGGTAVLRGDPLPSLVGMWAGTWQDTVYTVGGTFSFVIVGGPGDSLQATGEIDLSDLGIGLQNGTAAGLVTGNTLDFEFTAASVGTGTGSVAGVAGQGSGTVTAPLSFGDFTFTGSIGNGEISGTFDFTSPTGGAGTASLQLLQSVDRESWGGVKSRYR